MSKLQGITTIFHLLDWNIKKFDNTLYTSTAFTWNLGVKYALGFRIWRSFERLFGAYTVPAGYGTLPYNQYVGIQQQTNYGYSHEVGLMDYRQVQVGYCYQISQG